MRLFLTTAFLALSIVINNGSAQTTTTQPSNGDPDPVLPNPDFAAVQAKLDMGGTSYFYTNAEGYLDSTLNFARPFAKLHPQASAGLSMVEAGLRKLGLAEINDFGFSSAQLQFGVSRQKTYLHLKSRTGIFRLAGGEPMELTTLNYVPSDADAAWCSNLEPGLLLPVAREVVEAGAGGVGRGMMDDLLQKGRVKTGIDWEKVSSALGNEIGVHLQVNSADQEETTAGEVIFVARIRVKDQTLAEAAKAILPKVAKLEGKPKVGNVSVWEVQPLESDTDESQKDNQEAADEAPVGTGSQTWFIATSPEWFIVTNSMHELSRAEKAAQGTENLRASDEFRQRSAGMPEKINAVSYISQAYVDFTMAQMNKAMEQAKTELEAEVSSEDDEKAPAEDDDEADDEGAAAATDEVDEEEAQGDAEDNGAMLLLLQTAQKTLSDSTFFSAHASWRVNDPKGIQWVKRGGGSSHPAVLTGAAATGMVVAIAVPAFLRARENSRSAACQENLAILDGAKEQYALEHKKANGAAVTMDMLRDYLRKEPECPSGGDYRLGKIGENPTCSLGESDPESPYAHVLP